jgi:hypothetical protein
VAAAAEMTAAAANRLLLKINFHKRGQIVPSFFCGLVAGPLVWMVSFPSKAQESAN